MKIKLTLTEEMLGTGSANPEIHREFIAAKAPDAKSQEEEVAAIGVDASVEKAMTVFHRNDGKPVLFGKAKTKGGGGGRQAIGGGQRAIGG